MLEQPTLDWKYDSKSEEDRIILTASGFAGDEALILTARFSPNSLTDVVPQWQLRKEQSDAATAKALPIGFVAGITTLILSGLGFFTYVRANSRDLNISTIVTTANPPADVPRPLWAN